MHKAERPSNCFFSNSFTYNQAEQIKKGVTCVQILLEIHLTKHGRFHVQGRTTFYTPVLVYFHDTSQLCRKGLDDKSRTRMTTFAFILSELICP